VISIKYKLPICYVDVLQYNIILSECNLYEKGEGAKYSQLSSLNCAFATMWLYSYKHIVFSESYDGHKLHDY